MKIRFIGIMVIMCIIVSMCVQQYSFAGEKTAAENIYSDDYYYFKDRNGNEMMAPKNAFAAEVIEFIQGNPWTTYEEQQKVNNVLGVADRTGDGSTSVGDLCLGTGGVIVLRFDVAIYDGDGPDVYVFEVGGAVEATEVEVSNDLNNWYDIGKVEGATAGIDLNGKIPEGSRFRYVRLTDLSSDGPGGWPGADIDAVSGLNVKAVTSDWAGNEIDKAERMGLVPDILNGKDMTKNISRLEFASVAVKVYENLNGTKAMPIVNNPFNDTSDVEVMKALQIGAVNGTSPTTFEPDALLNREQCAAMLTRVFKRITLAGWTLDSDSEFTLNYSMPSLFADDKDISEYAKDSVYFMAANNIIKGIEGNKFAPKNTTTAQEAEGYANATREQALAIAVRMVENLG